MMRRLIAAAALVLAVQIGLIVALSQRDSGYAPFSPSELVVPLEPAAIKEISLLSRDEGEIRLEKVDGAWLIDGPEGLQVPAAAVQVEDFLSRITSFKRGLAVATSKDAAARFEVGSDDPAYRLTLKTDSTTVRLYFGTSSGFRQIHARREGSDEIITLPLGSHELSAAVEQWLDKSLVKFDRQRLQTLLLDGLTLQRTGDGWQVRSDAGQELPAGQQAQRLVELLSDLSVHGFAKRGEGDAGTGEVLAFETVLDDGTRLQWRISPYDDNSMRIVRSDLDYSLLISSWQIDDSKKIIEEIRAGKTEGAAAGTTSEGTEPIPHGGLSTD